MNDQSVSYKGPKAEFVTITGSPLWAVGVENYEEHAVERGWEHVSTAQYPTPYGLSPLIQHFRTPTGRDVVRIPSYGMVVDRDWRYDQTGLKLFWLLWKIGTKVMLVGGTSGVADWRKEPGVKPGDLVLPWSFRTSPEFRGIPNSPFETAWPRFDLLLNDPFCTHLSGQLAEIAREYVPQGLLGAVHTPEDVRAALVLPDSITFETDFDVLMWASISSRISEMQPDKPPVITLHGDCINPIGARLLGIHMVYYHMVANVAQGLPADRKMLEQLQFLYLGNFLNVALEMEFRLLETMPLPDGSQCSCVKSLAQAPGLFTESMTQGE